MLGKIFLLNAGSNKIDEKALDILLNNQLSNLVALYLGINMVILDSNKKITDMGFLKIFDKTRGQL